MLNDKIHSNQNSHKCRQVFIGALLGNLVLALLKFSMGIFGYSKLVLMDGILSFSSGIVLYLMWQGDRLEKKEFDENHPYGYGKSLFLIASMAGLVILIISMFMIFYSISSMSWLEVHRSHSGAMMVTVISIVGNEVIYRYLQEESKRYSNHIMVWNAVNNRIGVVVSSLILFFVLLASVGATYIERIGVGVVALIMFFMSLRILYMAFGGIMDKAPAQKILDQIKRFVLKKKVIKDVPSVNARYIGSFLHVDLSVVLAENLTMREADSITREVELKLIERLPFIREINVSIA